ncbi:hypothetical protein JL09_g6523, partial [Pichia kudriavzevii]
EFSFS